MTRRALLTAFHLLCALAFLLIAVSRVFAGAHADATQAFADHCFSPLMTGPRAQAVLPPRHDFYDLRPFNRSNAVSPPNGRPVTPGTDRRCEVSFDGADVEAGVAGAVQGLEQEGISREAAVPADFPRQPGTQFIAARQLNPNRIAVVQVGTRPGPNGVETFINVERLVPLDGS